MTEAEDCADAGLAQGLTELLTAQAPAQAGALELAVRSLLAELDRGYIGLPLNELHLQELWAALGLDHVPDLARWRSELSASGMLGGEAGRAPLVESCGHLYFRRQLALETGIAGRLRCLAVTSPALRVTIPLDEWDRYFPATDEGPDWQRVAAWVALRSSLAVISGGPGTGKTSTLVRLLSMLRSHHPGLRMVLAAPTGKAAQRMSEAAGDALQKLGDEAAEMELPEAMTLHRLLGLSQARKLPRYHRERPLPFDLVAVDEVSMLDVEMMSQLLDAVANGTRLILLGDHQQLQSVEAGSVLYDLCAEPKYPQTFSEDLRRELDVHVPPASAGAQSGALAGCLVRLRRSWRFADDTGLGRLAGAVLDGDLESVQDSLEAAQGLQWTRIGHSLDRDTCQGFVKRFAPVMHAARQGDAALALDALGSFRLLCGVRGGPLGVQQVNQTLEQLLRQQHELAPDSIWFAGRIVMVRVNDYRCRLFNGDVGVAVVTDDGLRVAFSGTDGIRLFYPGQLPRHEAAFAMTVHKSQGSEFDAVALILPTASSALLTRSLLYTGVTRSRKAVHLYASPEALAQAVETAPKRISALRERLWEA